MPAVEATIDTERFSLPIGLPPPAAVLEAAEATDGLGETEPEDEDVEGRLKRAKRLGDFFGSSFFGVCIVFLTFYYLHCDVVNRGKISLRHDWMSRRNAMQQPS